MKSHSTGIILTVVLSICWSSLLTLTSARTTVSPNDLVTSSDDNTTAFPDAAQINEVANSNINGTSNSTIPTSASTTTGDDRPDTDEDLDDDDMFKQIFGGLEPEYVAMIGMGALIVLLFFTTLVIICTLGGRRNVKS